jgi:prepilin-type N-terminal cleavage/methylation domain-containing protein
MCGSGKGMETVKSNDVQRRSAMNKSNGFTLVELMAVIAIMAILLALAGIAGKRWMDQYYAESEIKTMHTDLLQTRAKAMGQNLQYLVAVGPGSYRIGFINDSGATTWQTPVTLKYPISSPASSMTLTFDTKGLLSTPVSAIQFNTGAGKPEYDCLELYETRIKMGRVNGTNCDPR